MKRRCPLCGKRFATRPGFERHILEETGAAVTDLEDMGIVERRGGLVELTAAGRELAALRQSVRDEGRDPDEDLVIREEGAEFVVYDAGAS